MTEDPNKDRNDPMVPEYWALGEDLMEEMRSAGLGGEALEAVAVDVHDILQAAEQIRAVLASPEALDSKLQVLRFEAAHLRWHTGSLISTLGPE